MTQHDDETVHNDPSSIAARTAKAQELADAAEKWRTATITSPDESQDCGDLLRVARDESKKLPELRDADPDVIAGKEATARWKRIIDLVAVAESTFRKKINDYLVAEREKQRAAAEDARRAAEEAKRDAEEVGRRAVETGSVIDAFDAQQAQAAARIAAKQATAAKRKEHVSVGGIYGRAIGIRQGPARARIAGTTDEEIMANKKKAVAWAFRLFPDAVMELVIQKASAEARGKRSLPTCFETYREESAA